MAIVKRTAAAAVALFLALLWAPATGEAADGKELFLKYKCTKCHTIQSEGVGKTEEPNDEAEEHDPFDDFAADEEDVEPPDLSGVGKEHEADWMMQFLMKRIANDEGRKHRERFKGTEAELKTLVEYLSCLEAGSSDGSE